MTHLLPSPRHFWRHEDASMTVEAVIWIPFLLATVLSVFAVFDLFRAQTLNQKAAYTIGDTLSRETGLVTSTYIDNSEKLVALLTSQKLKDVGLRVTVLEWDAEDKTHMVKWSKARAPYSDLTEMEKKALFKKAPVMVNGEQIIVTETWTANRSYELLQRGKKGYFASAFTRPRYAPQLRYADE